MHKEHIEYQVPVLSGQNSVASIPMATGLNIWTTCEKK
jgi:hypothetical protein